MIQISEGPDNFGHLEQHQISNRSMRFPLRVLLYIVVVHPRLKNCINDDVPMQPPGTPAPGKSLV
mgnify:CR=1 FL=1